MFVHRFTSACAATLAPSRTKVMATKRSSRRIAFSPLPPQAGDGFERETCTSDAVPVTAHTPNGRRAGTDAEDTNARDGTPRALERSRELDEGDVGRARPLRAVDDLELHLVAFVQGAETLGADLGMVDEDVRTTLTREETEALGLVEPLDSAFDHERAGLLACCLV